MTDQSGEAVVYYQITLAVHVDLLREKVDRVVELREEIHPQGTTPSLVTDDGHFDCPQELADIASRIADTKPWPAAWEFGY